MKRTRVASGVIAGATTLTLTFGIAGIAVAVTQSGQQACSGTQWTRLSINAKSSGTGRWTKYSDVSKTTKFIFPGGASQPWGEYQSNVWHVVASGGFYSKTTSTCI
ncbi:MAG: hypothetical protein QM655_08470 [Nocardioidaceae bacterium]